MNKSFKLALGLVFVALASTGCVKKGDTRSSSSEPIRKVAIVSLAVNASASMGWSVRSGSVDKLVSSHVNRVVGVTEKELSRIMHVTPVSQFNRSAAYRKFGVNNGFDFILPEVNGKRMIFFSSQKDDVKDGVLTPQVAKELCSMLHVDGVVMIFSQWDVDRGAFVPQNMAWVANTLTVWDRNGEMVFRKRVGEDGNIHLGFGVARVNSRTINEWDIAYKKSIEEILKDMKSLAHA
jgi:hypothetical protein